MIDSNEQGQTDAPASALLLDGAFAKELGLGTRELDTALAAANAKLQAGNHDKALSMYAMLVLCRPQNVNYQCALANCALKMQEYEMALQAASAAVALDPRDCRGYYLSGAACFGLGHLDEAREDIADALSFAEGSPHRDVLEASRRLDMQLNASLT
ncbi:hypothetical protein [Yoonia sp. BS5-3]|uniref:Tetratricopeptide repeat protein n=1 Tax=Yoonia phaeophyticola TaxID=3137369 RepID=A0ABZ2V7J5_9RHOB